jgi:hypothetical protein
MCEDKGEAGNMILRPVHTFRLLIHADKKKFMDNFQFISGQRCLLTKSARFISE